MAGQGFAQTDWSKLETFGLRRGDPKRWKLNRHAPEGHTNPKTGRIRIKNSNANLVKFPEVDPAYGVVHSIRQDVKSAESRWLNSPECQKLVRRKVCLSTEKARLVKHVLKISKDNGISPTEAANKVRPQIQDLDFKIKELETKIQFERNRVAALENR